MSRPPHLCELTSQIGRKIPISKSKYFIEKLYAQVYWPILEHAETPEPDSVAMCCTQQLYRMTKYRLHQSALYPKLKLKKTLELLKIYVMKVLKESSLCENISQTCEALRTC